MKFDFGSGHRYSCSRFQPFLLPRGNHTWGLSYSKLLYAPGAGIIRVPFPLPVQQLNPYPVVEGA
jgi:hypothetical protein